MLHASYAIGMVRHTMIHELAKNITDTRKRLGESQQVFATRIGTNMMTLRSWEKGERQPLLFRHIEALASEGVDMDLLRAGAARRLAA